MNLYKVIFCHYGPKDSRLGISKYFIANDDEECYNKIYPYGTFVEEDEESTKEEVQARGEMFTDMELTDLYYGRTLYGWKLVKESISEEDIENLKSLNILEG